MFGFPSKVHSITVPILIVATLMPPAMSQPYPDPPFDADALLTTAADKVSEGLADYRVDPDRIPRSLEPDGSLRQVRPRDWTSGFFPGVLWQLYDYRRDTTLLSAAREWTLLLEEESRSARDHDIGFRIYCSYGQGWRVTQDPEYREAMVRAAAALLRRFNPDVGAIKSWNGDSGEWEYPVIIDNMMNLELLFAVSRLTGDLKYRDVAIRHAETTLRDHFRDDGSSYHVVDYNESTGRIRQRRTHQGASDESAWARGQSWALYGFTMAYRETNDPRFLEQAIEIANFILGNPSLPKDGVPYWDYNAPGIPDAQRDASAAAIMASALYELKGYVSEQEAQRFVSAADRQLAALWTDYSAPDDVWPFILDESVGNMNIDSEVGGPIIYADYYFIEALRRRALLDNG